MMYRDSFILNLSLVLVVSKREKQSLEHLPKQSVDYIQC